jgi:hypothetical protein
MYHIDRVADVPWLGRGAIDDGNHRLPITQTLQFICLHHQHRGTQPTLVIFCSLHLSGSEVESK